MMGININCKQTNFLKLIFQGYKTVETRNTHSLRPYVGKRVGLVRTGCGKAALVGFATIVEEVHYSSVKQFRSDYKHHRVKAGSKYDIKREKYGYVLTNISKIKPVQVNSKGIIARQIDEERSFQQI